MSQARSASALTATAGAARPQAPEWVRHERLIEWVGSIAALTRPDRIHWCDGSQQEYLSLIHI